MSGRFRTLIFFSVPIVILFLILVRGSFAQSPYLITLTPPDISDFPNLTTYLDVHDSSGGFVHGLTMKDVSVQENSTPVVVNGVIEEKPGVEFVVAIAAGSTYAIRDATGTSRYQYLLQGMLAGSWINESTRVDDFCLLTMGGPQLSHSSNPSMLGSLLASYQPEDPKSAPTLEILASALQVATGSTLRPGMERAILFVTPPQSSEVSLGLQSIISRAIQQRIHIFVWLVAPREAFDLPDVELLRNLAAQTNASFFAFSRDEPVPDLETLLDPLRYVYQVGYASQASSAGAQEVVAQVNIDGEQYSSQPQAYELNLKAPVLVFLNPPSEIARKYTTQATPGTNGSVSELQPSEDQLNIQVTFPDGYVRPLTRTSLYVDGEIVAENTSPPFEQMVWDLRPYTQDGSHTLRIEAVDNLGWVGQSSDLTVKISVPSTVQEVVSVFSQKRGLVIGITIFISASVLILVLIIGGRIRPKPYPGQVKHSPRLVDGGSQQSFRQRLSQLKDPVTQPVKLGSDQRQPPNPFRDLWKWRLPWLRHAEKPVAAMAYLLPLSGSDEPTLPAPMEITTSEVTLGCDPQKASLMINDPSVEKLHATIRQEGNLFMIMDAGSAAGTWVNYLPVASTGSLLEHADIIHLGRVGFRFTKSNPDVLYKVSVIPIEPEHDPD